MGRPNLSHVVLKDAETITLQSMVQTVVNHRPVNTPTPKDIKARVSTPTSEDLKQLEVDTSLKYQLIHCVEPVKVNDRFTYNGVTYKIISSNDRSNYGFYRAVGEEIKV